MEIKYTDSIGNYVEIEPIKTNFTDKVFANIITIYMQDDTISCVVDYKLHNLNVTEETITLPDDTTETRNTVNVITLFSNSITISGDDYKKWSGDSEYVFNYIINTLNLTLPNG